MPTSHTNSSGFTTLELILWIFVFLVTLFLVLPFYNTWMKKSKMDSSGNDIDSQFHFESWNEELLDSNVTAD